MVKKLQKMADKHAASPAGLLDSQLAATVKESAQQIWLAGLGAFSKAQAEGKVVFEALVKEGTSLQKKTQVAAEERMGEMSERVNTLTQGVSTKAGAQWDKLESIFEDRVSRALGKLGVPATQDLKALSARVDALAAEVARLGKVGGAKGASAAKAAAKAVDDTLAQAAPKKRAARKAAAKAD